MERDELIRRCRDEIRRGSKSFASAARLFEPRTRDSVFLLYAWCRHCDDRIDGQTLGHVDAPLTAEAARERLAELREETARCYSGAPLGHPAFEALRRVALEHALEPRFPHELLDGFEMDVRGLRYRSFEELLRYCYHVAGTVGLMMSRVIGARDPRSAKPAMDLGIAMQLTNIARDVIEDARIGRVYLPLDWLEAAGVPAGVEGVLDPGRRGALAGVVRRLLEEARAYYASGDHGLGYLPMRSALAVAAAREVYSAIGGLIRRRGARAWDERAVVPAWRRPALLARASARVLLSRVRPASAACLPSHAFLEQDGGGAG